MDDAPVQDSPVGWVNAHIKAYVESDGRKGHEWKPGVPTLLLTTTGWRSGIRRRTALIYGQDGSDVVVVASKGGAAEDPAWYRNLSADPQVEVQVGAEVHPAVARTAEGEERVRLWAAMADIWPYYDGYAKKTRREIPVVILARMGTG